MKQVKDRTVESSGTTPQSSGGGGGPSKTWSITGTLRVRESELEGTSKDRPLKGIEVKVQASDVGASGPWSTWGTTRTDAQGAWRLTEANNGSTRFFRVQARLVASDLTVEDGSLVDLNQVDLADRNWRTIWKSGRQLAGPGVTVGTRVVASGQAEDLGDAEFRRQALLWYVMRTTIDTLASKDAWFALEDQLKVLYPARSGIGVSYRSWSTMHLQEGSDDWKPDTALQYFWQAWHDDHTSTSRSEHFSTGFGAFATMAITHELWNGRLHKPYNRRYVAAGLSISTMEELENEPLGVQHALRLLRYDGRRGWWSHLFGTAQRYPAGREDADGDGSPDFPAEPGVKHRLAGRVVPGDEPDHLTLWEILQTFRADQARGWPRDFALQDDDDGLLTFFDRVVSIHGLSENTHAMLLDALDPLRTEEPFEWLPTA
ncbi:hypothetical protein ABZ477_17620 [Microbacterium sp. NPDC019599]|uniref:hypothetical protein n=1 Tax=Microbacterium sp. NPDC019599 TaxID=3154690 RepID=UPI0033EB08B5